MAKLRDFVTGKHARSRSGMTDYARIKLSRKSGRAEFYWVRSKHIVPVMTLRRHRDSVAWHTEQLNEKSAGHTVVVTHHAPHPNSVPTDYQGHPLTPAYASDLSLLMGKSAVWIHGHVHESFDYLINGTRGVCNACGYPYGNPPRGENEKFASALLSDVGGK